MQFLDRTGVGTLWSMCKTKFALKDHSHNYLPLSGGTLTGDLLFSNSGTTFRQIRGTCGDNDFWRIGGGATGNNAGYMEIATADDGNEPIYVRQYSGTFSSVNRTLTLLDANGYTHFPSYISIGGNENNNSSPDRVWGSNGSDSYLRSYRTSALNVAYASSAGNADTVDGEHLIKNGSGTGIKQVYYFNMQGTNASYIKLGTLSTVSGTGSGSSKVMFTVKGGIDFGGTNESVYEVAASTRGSIQVTSTLVRGNRELKFGYVSTSSNVEIWMAYDRSYRGVTEVEVSSSVNFTLAMTETTTKPSGFVEGSYRILASTDDNVASATKLQTPRNIWGQSFDGTGNVSGDMTDVCNIHFKVNNSYDIGSNDAASRYIYTYWLGARSGQKLELGANNSGFGQGLCIDTNLNVGISTNTPAYKLHVAGDIYTTTGFKKNGSSDSYVLLGGGGHKLESSLNVASASVASNASTVNGHTVNANVPSNAKFTDTNTWRPIQDNLTSTSTSESLSANQGRILKGLVDGKANSSDLSSYSQKSETIKSIRIEKNGYTQGDSKLVQVLHVFKANGEDDYLQMYNADSNINGLMSYQDKVKLDGIASGANNYSLPTASATTLGGIKISIPAYDTGTLWPIILDNNGAAYTSINGLNKNNLDGSVENVIAKNNKYSTTYSSTKIQIRDMSQNKSALLDFPAKSGTLALLSDIPDVSNLCRFNFVNSISECRSDRINFFLRCPDSIIRLDPFDSYPDGTILLITINNNMADIEHRSGRWYSDGDNVSANYTCNAYKEEINLITKNNGTVHHYAFN